MKRRKRNEDFSSLPKKLQELPFAVSMYVLDFFKDVEQFVRILVTSREIIMLVMVPSADRAEGERNHEKVKFPSEKGFLHLVSLYFGYFKNDRFRKTYQVFRNVEARFKFFSVELPKGAALKLCWFVPIATTHVCLAVSHGTTVPTMDFSIEGCFSIERIQIGNISLTPAQLNQLRGSTRNLVSISLLGITMNEIILQQQPFFSHEEGGRFLEGLNLKKLKLQKIEIPSFKRFCSNLFMLKSLSSVIIGAVNFNDESFSNLRKFSHLKPFRLEIWGIPMTLQDELLRLLSDNAHEIRKCRLFLSTDHTFNFAKCMQSSRDLALYIPDLGQHSSNKFVDIISNCQYIEDLWLMIGLEYDEVREVPIVWDTTFMKFQDLEDTSTFGSSPLLFVKRVTFGMMRFTDSFCKWFSNVTRFVEVLTLENCYDFNIKFTKALFSKMEKLKTLKVSLSARTETYLNKGTSMKELRPVVSIVVASNCQTLKNFSIDFADFQGNFPDACYGSDLEEETKQRRKLDVPIVVTTIVRLDIELDICSTSLGEIVVQICSLKKVEELKFDCKSLSVRQFLSESLRKKYQDVASKCICLFLKCMPNLRFLIIPGFCAIDESFQQSMRKCKINNLVVVVSRMMGLFTGDNFDSRLKALSHLRSDLFVEIWPRNKGPIEL